MPPSRRHCILCGSTLYRLGACLSCLEDIEKGTHRAITLVERNALVAAGWSVADLPRLVCEEPGCTRPRALVGRCAAHQPPVVRVPRSAARPLLRAPLLVAAPESAPTEEGRVSVRGHPPCPFHPERPIRPSAGLCVVCVNNLQCLQRRRGPVPGAGTLVRRALLQVRSEWLEKHPHLWALRQRLGAAA